MDHDEIKELLGAHALNAVDGREAVIVQRHILHCSECRLEHDDHRKVVTMLSATARFAPANLWLSIARELLDRQTAAGPSLEPPPAVLPDQKSPRIRLAAWFRRKTIPRASG
jgi:hypothetical protein